MWPSGAQKTELAIQGIGHSKDFPVSNLFFGVVINYDPMQTLCKMLGDWRLPAWAERTGSCMASGPVPASDFCCNAVCACGPQSHLLCQCRTHKNDHWPVHMREVLVDALTLQAKAEQELS